MANLSFARQQQGEQAVAGVSYDLQYPVGSAQAPYLAVINDALQIGANDVLSCFDQPLQTLLILRYKKYKTGYQNQNDNVSLYIACLAD